MFYNKLVFFSLYMSNNRHNFDLEFSLSNEDIYLDSATLGRLPTSSIRKIQDFYGTKTGGTIRGTHRLAIEASKVLEEKRDSIARIFNVAPNQLSFLPSREVAVLNSLFYLDKTKKNRTI